MNAEKRRDRVIALKLGGATCRQIVTLLASEGIKVSLTTVVKDVQKRLRDHIAASSEQTEALRSQMSMRLDRLLMVWWPRALGTAQDEPDPAALDRVRGLLRDLRELHGLNAPQQTELSIQAAIDRNMRIELVEPPEQPQISDRSDVVDAEVVSG